MLASQFGKSELFVPFFWKKQRSGYNSALDKFIWRLLGGMESIELDDFIQDFSL
jgi:hypothetical protein